MGHCATGCTSRWIPPEGISVFAAFLHTHTSGRGVRFQHFRGNEELPWISSDDNFNFNYQQVRLLREERRILPGDQLIQTCVYNTMARNGSAVVGGHSTRHEMCMAFAYFYNRIPGFATCASQIETEEYANLVGIYNTTFDRTRGEAVIAEPAQYAGLSVANYATNNINWDTQMRSDLQRHHRLQPHTSYCPNAVATVGEAAVSRLTGNNAVSVPNGNSNVGNSAMSQYESRFRADITPFSPPPRCLKQSESRGGNHEAVRPGSETKQFGRTKFGRGRRENGRGWSHK
ncbi:DBH-like monooxygenase protein 1 [Orchesella cincta]|uniref:DBH-like monooxygenase protein 1 n=1 Tax=Orchesella cincta TaxID=48709 RepID=A0A1D2MAF2_ORCCI|nr:DBH-like monooxygenase protein 1 [Orchesella cincta]